MEVEIEKAARFTEAEVAEKAISERDIERDKWLMR